MGTLDQPSDRDVPDFVINDMKGFDDIDHEELARLAIDAANKNLRWRAFDLCSCLIFLHRGTSLVQDTIYELVRDPEDLTDLLISYARIMDTSPRNLRRIMTHGLRKGLARAIHKFKGDDLIKSIKPGPVTIRDVVALAHAKPGGGVTGRHLERIMNSSVRFSSSDNIYILHEKRRGVLR